MAFQTNIELLYRAGKLRFPDAAESVGAVATALGGHLHALDQEAARAGDPPVMRHLLAVGQAVEEELIATVTACNNAAVAMIATATDYQRTDAGAQTDFNHLSQALKDADIPQYTPPEGVGDLAAPGSTTTDTTPRPGVHGQTTPDPQVVLPSTPAPVDPDTDLAGRNQTEDATGPTTDADDLVEGAQQ